MSTLSGKTGGLLIFLVILLAIAPIHIVSAAGGGFYVGPNPEKGEAGRLVYTLEPGDEIDAEVYVANNGDDHLDLLVFNSDAVTSQDGYISFPDIGETSENGTGSWITLSRSEASLAPGQGEVIPFIVSVPAGAGPGEYVAGIVAQDTELSPAVEEGDIQIRVLNRGATKVIVTVPGPQVAGLDILSVEPVWHNADVVFNVELRNTGNILIKGEGTLEVFSSSGNAIGTFPISIRWFVPGDTIVYPVYTHGALPPASYSLTVAMQYERARKAPEQPPIGIQEVEFSSTFEITAQEIEEIIEQAEEAGWDLGDELPSTASELPSTASEVPWNTLLMIIAAAAVLAVITTVLTMRRWGRSKASGRLPK